MKIVDVNVLLYVVNESSPKHKPLLHWWETAINGDETVGLPWVVLIGFLRVSTNPKIFPNPLSAADAVARIDRWLAIANTYVAKEKGEHWQVMTALLADSGTAGNLTTDAHLAALAITHGATLASCDHDFARFRGLRWENPADVR